MPSALAGTPGVAGIYTGGAAGVAVPGVGAEAAWLSPAKVAEEPAGLGLESGRVVEGPAEAELEFRPRADKLLRALERPERFELESVKGRCTLTSSRTG